jgi:hypothetical protein
MAEDAAARLDAGDTFDSPRGLILRMAGRQPKVLFVPLVGAGRTDA